MAGLSMGGMQTFQIGTTHTGAVQLPRRLQRNADGAGPGAGGRGRRTGRGVPQQDAPAVVRSRNHREPISTPALRKCEPSSIRRAYPSGYYESPGTAHEFQTWRRCLHEFAPLLFQTAASTVRKTEEESMSTRRTFLKQNSLLAAGAWASLSSPFAVKPALAASASSIADHHLR